MVKNHHIFINGDIKKNSHLGIIKDKWCMLEAISTKENKRGKDAVTVYKIKYKPACRRSGWYPHPIIINNVGINDASK